jgi:tRNA nucleotidyltransferase (CCA-adding enzyme)
MNSKRWEHFDHDADIGVRGIGSSIEEAFEQAAIAMTAAVTDPDSVAAARQAEIECEAPDVELLLVEWLNALVYEMATKRMLFSRFQVKIDGARLQARVWGEPVDRDRHAPAVEVKGATYTDLRVGREESGDWAAQCVVDV